MYMISDVPARTTSQGIASSPSSTAGFFTHCVETSRKRCPSDEFQDRAVSIPSSKRDRLSGSCMFTRPSGSSGTQRYCKEQRSPKFPFLGYDDDSKGLGRERPPLSLTPRSVALLIRSFAPPRRHLRLNVPRRGYALFTVLSAAKDLYLCLSPSCTPSFTFH